MASKIWIAVAALMAGPAASVGAPPDDGVDRFIADPLLAPASAAAVTARCDAAIARVTALRTQLEATSGAPTVATTFRAYDDLESVQAEAANEQYLIAQTNPSAALRAAAEACSQRISDAGGSLDLSRPIYDRLSGIPRGGLDPATAHILGRVLLRLRLAGVDRDAATRAQIDAVQQKISAAVLKFDGNIRDQKGETVFASPNDLAGLPADYLAAHRPGADGKIHISTDYPDTVPIFSYADREATRHAVATTFNHRAWPENGPVLKELLAQREQLAHLLGYPNYAALAIADKMAATPERALAFIGQVNTAALPGARKDYAELLARWRRIDPAATAVYRWNDAYVERLLRKERYDVDDAVVRRYFTYAKARTGIFQLTRDLFGADIRPWRTPVWAPGVTAWGLYDGKRLVGRFYIDPFPRAGKYSHAQESPIRSGVKGRSIPLAALITNFPATGPMDHGDVLVFLHEFGHLLHELYSGNQQWELGHIDGLESDFIEAPSQLLEEWVWDYPTLARFASDPQGHPIPQDLVARMNRARRFGIGAAANAALPLSGISLAYYMEPAAQSISTAICIRR